MDTESPPSHANCDEVIADSEEEMEYAKSFSGVCQSSLNISPAFQSTPIDSSFVRHLSAASTKRPLHANAVSSISDFTTIAYGARSDEIVSHSIADRAKTRQRTQGTKKRAVIHRDDDVIELTSEDDVVEKGTKSSARSVKPKPRPKPKLKVKIADTSVATSSHIDAIDSEQPRPRVRPRPIVKRARPTLDSLPPPQYPFTRDSFIYDMPAIQPPISTPVPYYGQPDLPIATSPVTISNAIGTGTASQLPPSDPPNSTNTTGIVDTLPPIEILQDGESERDGDIHLLSPSSLFSDRDRPKAKKRKRAVVLDVLENEIDQLIPSSPHRLDPTPHEPPPTFFAGSSSSAAQYVGERDPNAFPNPQTDVIDLTDLPPTITYAEPSKPNKKIKVNTRIDPTEDVRRDEGDSDFKPSARQTAKKRKGKGKVPEKEDMPKEKKGRTRKKKEQMDGVVLQARDRAGKTKTKAKQIEKGVFKSREIIDDSDENDPLLLVEGMQGAGIPLPLTTDSPKVSDVIAGSLSSAKSSSSTVDEPISSAAGSKGKAKSTGRKRKLIVESDQEGSEKGNEIQDCIVVKRRKSASDAPVSDDGEQERLDEPKNAQKGARSGKDKPEVQMSPQSAGGNRTSGTRQDKTKDSKDCQRSNVQKTGKENISGHSASSAVRPLANRATSINPDVSTPLYTRYEVAPRRSSLPMSELIRRASIKPGSPFLASLTPSQKDRGKGKRPELDVDAACSASTPLSVTAYSPYLKMSRRTLSRIAPLHLTRKTPPPPAPPPPQKKKTKKELEREEKWEEELVESVGGIEVWVSMEDSERKEMRRAKMDMEVGGYED